MMTIVSITLSRYVALQKLHKGVTRIFLAATPVTVGFQQTAYSVHKTYDYQVVCAEVLSGDIAGRIIKIDYRIANETAQGKRVK